MNNPKANAVLIEALSSSLRATENGLGTVPDLLKRVLEEESWRAFTTPRGELVEHERFADFVVTPPTAGLGASTDLLKRIVADSPETLDALDRALTGKSGTRTDLVNNVNEVVQPARPAGNRQDAALRRLRKDRPDLHERVLAGELSAHRAMIEAGFRARTISVPVSRPEAAARTLRKNLSHDEIEQLIKLLSEESAEDGT